MIYVIKHWKKEDAECYTSSKYGKTSTIYKTGKYRVDEALIKTYKSRRYRHFAGYHYYITVIFNDSNIKSFSIFVDLKLNNNDEKKKKEAKLKAWEMIREIIS